MPSPAATARIPKSAPDGALFLWIGEMGDLSGAVADFKDWKQHGEEWECPDSRAVRHKAVVTAMKNISNPLSWQHQAAPVFSDIFRQYGQELFELLTTAF